MFRAFQLLWPSPRRGTPNYDADDIFVPDGQELVACKAGMASPSCTTGGTHATKIESYLRIKLDRSANSWEIRSRDGTKTILRAVTGRARPPRPDAGAPPPPKPSTLPAGNSQWLRLRPGALGKRSDAIVAIACGLSSLRGFELLARCALLARQRGPAAAFPHLLFFPANLPC